MPTNSPQPSGSEMTNTNEINHNGKQLWLRFAFASVLVAALLIGLAVYEAMMRNNAESSKTGPSILSSEPSGVNDATILPDTIRPEELQKNSIAGTVAATEKTTASAKPTETAAANNTNAADTANQQPIPYTGPAAATGYRWNLDGFYEYQNAVRLQRQLMEMGYSARVVSRVEVGPFANQKAAEASRNKSQKAFNLPAAKVLPPVGSVGSVGSVGGNKNNKINATITPQPAKTTTTVMPPLPSVNGSSINSPSTLANQPPAEQKPEEIGVPKNAPPEQTVPSSSGPLPLPTVIQ